MSQRKPLPSLLGFAFNQDAGCFSVGTLHGFRVFNSEPYKEQVLGLVREWRREAACQESGGRLPRGRFGGPSWLPTEAWRQLGRHVGALALPPPHRACVTHPLRVPLLEWHLPAVPSRFRKRGHRYRCEKALMLHPPYPRGGLGQRRVVVPQQAGMQAWRRSACTGRGSEATGSSHRPPLSQWPPPPLPAAAPSQWRCSSAATFWRLWAAATCPSTRPTRVRCVWAWAVGVGVGAGGGGGGCMRVDACVCVWWWGGLGSCRGSTGCAWTLCCARAGIMAAEHSPPVACWRPAARIPQPKGWPPPLVACRTHLQ